MKAQRQSRKSKRRIVVLARQIFNDSEKPQVRIDAIAAAEIDLLPRSSEISVGKQQRGAKEAVEEERTVITAADEISGQGEAEPVTGVIE